MKKENQIQDYDGTYIASSDLNEEYIKELEKIQIIVPYDKDPNEFTGYNINYNDPWTDPSANETNWSSSRGFFPESNTPDFYQPKFNSLSYNINDKKLKIWDGTEWLDLFSSEEIYLLAEKKFDIPIEEKDMQRFNIFENNIKSSIEIEVIEKRKKLHKMLIAKLKQLEQEIKNG